MEIFINPREKDYYLLKIEELKSKCLDEYAKLKIRNYKMILSKFYGV